MPAFGVKTTTTIGVEPFDRSIPLRAADARLNGTELRLESQHGHSYITGWNNPAAGVLWALNFRKQATYEISVRCSSHAGPTEFVVEIAGTKLRGRAPQTTNASDFVTIEVGRVEVKANTPLELNVRPASPDTWHPIHLEAVFLNDVN